MQASTVLVSVAFCFVVLDFATSFCANIPTESNSDKTENLHHQNELEVPDYVDYTEDGSRRVGPVRDQGSCLAAGYAFAAAGLLEGFEIKNMTRQVIPLSVQNIIDCDHYDGGCSGGDVEQALRAVQDQGGLNREETYPYEAKNETFSCRYNKYDPFVTTMFIESIENLPSGDEKLLQKTVAEYGPVAVGLDASLYSFRNYKSGVYFDKDCRNNTNHHMLVVGYGTNGDGQDYWKLKNSWSQEWGLNGYMLLARNKNNHCGVAEKATIVRYSSESLQRRLQSAY